MHLLQAVSHLLETLAKPRLQRRLQLFIDGGAHFVELGGVGGLQLQQLRLQSAAHLGQAARAGLAQFGNAPGIGFTQRAELAYQRVSKRFLQQAQLLAKGVNLGVLRARGLGALLREGLLKRGHALGGLLAAGAGGLGQFAAQFTLQTVQTLGLGLYASKHGLLDLGSGLRVLGPKPATPAQQQDQQQNCLNGQSKPHRPKCNKSQRKTFKKCVGLWEVSHPPNALAQCQNLRV